jgi:hypothetical protein
MSDQLVLTEDDDLHQGREVAATMRATRLP